MIADAEQKLLEAIAEEINIQVPEPDEVEL